MPYRKTVFANEEIYHLTNRGVAQAPIFYSSQEYLRFLEVLQYYNNQNIPLSYSFFKRLEESKKEDIINRLKNENKPLVEIYSYCLMPNHFHLLLKQKADKGISKFLTLVQNGYAKYFNIKRRRSGSLFQDMFKAVRIETEERFVHTSRYIHLNPVTAYIIELEKLSSYPWSSFPEYVGVRDNGIVNSELILGIVGGKEKYREFVYNQVEYQRELSKIKHLLLENV